MKMLIVEDDRKVAGFIEMGLRMNGYVVGNVTVCAIQRGGVLVVANLASPRCLERQVPMTAYRFMTPETRKIDVLVM